MSLKTNSIGSIARRFGVSPHTLRYYEKIGLIPPISKNTSGRRVYSQNDIDRLHFIKRAQRMRFTLKEISSLITLGDGQSKEKPKIRKLVSEKLKDIDESLNDLNMLKKDLSRMLNDCISNDDESCPIIEGIKEPPKLTN